MNVFDFILAVFVFVYVAWSIGFGACVILAHQTDKEKYPLNWALLPEFVKNLWKDFPAPQQRVSTVIFFGPPYATYVVLSVVGTAFALTVNFVSNKIQDLKNKKD